MGKIDWFTEFIFAKQNHIVYHMQKSLFSALPVFIARILVIKISAYSLDYYSRDDLMTRGPDTMLQLLQSPPPALYPKLLPFSEESFTVTESVKGQ